MAAFSTARRVAVSGGKLGRRHLGDSVRGPPVTDFQGNLKLAKAFFQKTPVSYAEYKAQCTSLRLFAFSGVTAGCVLALFVNPPKSSYWSTWSPGYWSIHIQNITSSAPLFLTKKLEGDVGLAARHMGREEKPAESTAEPEMEPTVVVSPEAEPTSAPVDEAPPPPGNFKVCVCGGAGGIGQPLSLLMALDENVAELCIYDLSVAMVPAEGVAADLSHLETNNKVRAYSLTLEDSPIDKLEECLTGCHLVLVPAGLPRKPGMTRADLLGINAGIAKNIVEACAKHCPDAILALIVNPVNSVVPAMAELYKQKGLDPTKIVGVTTLDCVRANKFVHDCTGVPVQDIDIPVVGGHAGTTILPLFSQDAAGRMIPAEKIADMDKRVQDAGTEVVNAKRGKGSATLSMAYAGARLGKAVLSGLNGVETTECAYVASSGDLPYFASKVTFGTSGVKTVHPVGPLSVWEAERLKEVTEQLKEEIDAGLAFAAKP